MDENQPAGTVVGNFSSTDVDAADSFTYTLVTGPGSTDNASFTISNGQLKTASTFDFETRSSYSIRVRSTDAGGLTTEKQFNVTVQDVDEAPTDIALSANTVAENVSNGSFVGTFSTQDVDAETNFGYSLVAGAGSTDNASFAIVSGQLRTNGSFDFETRTSYAIRVRSTDQAGLSVEKQFTITVSNVNEAPTELNLSAASIAENQTAGTLIGTLSSADPDTGSTFLYSLASGTGSTDNGSFTITNDQLRTAASFNFEAKNSYAIRIRVSDQFGASFEKAFTVNVTDVNESPSIATDQTFTVTENAAANVVLGTVSASDPDLTAPFNTRIFSISDGNTNGAFAIDPTTGQLRVNNPAALDFETSPLFTLVISLSDGAGASAAPIPVNIQVKNVNEVPTITDLPDQSILEDSDGSSSTFFIYVSDPETPAGSLNVQATSSNPGLVPNSKLLLSGSGVARTLMVVPLAEQSGTATITVTVSDGTNVSTSSFDVTVVPVDDAPTVTSILPQTILEDHATTSLAFTIGDIDSPIGGLTVTATSSNAALIPNEGIVITGTGASRTLVATPAKDQSGTATITVTVSDGVLTTSKTFQITVTAVDDAPVITLTPETLTYHIKPKKVVAIDGGASIKDVDTPALNFNGSVLHVSGHTTKDQLSILKLGGVAKKGKSVLVNGTVIGTFAGGKKGIPLTINLNASATQPLVQSLLHEIGFKTADKSGSRTIEIQITNVGGLDTNTATRQIDIEP